VKVYIEWDGGRKGKNIGAVMPCFRSGVFTGFTKVKSIYSLI
jgi:hypothetical protein